MFAIPERKAETAPTQDACANCGSIDFFEDYAQGYVICSGCSATQRYRIIDQGAEWRDFSESGDPSKSRVSKVDEHINELSTQIGGIAFKHGDFQGSNSAVNRMASAQKKIALNAQNRSLLAGFDKLNAIADAISLGDAIRATAKDIFHDFEKKRAKSARGAKTEATMCAIIYSACKKEGFPRTIRELSKATTIEEKEIGKAYRNLIKLLPQDIKERTTPVDLVNRICSHLPAKPDHPTISAMKVVAGKAEDLVEGRAPASIAAAAIFLVLKLLSDPTSEQQVADASNVSVYTVRTVYLAILPHKAAIVPPEFAQKHNLNLGQ